MTDSSPLPEAVLLQKLRRVRLVALDVDGVLTDGRLHFDADGESFKSFHVHDGMGIKLLMEAGIEVAVVSARQSEPLARRVRELAIRHFLPHTRDKLGALRTLVDALGLDLEQVCFVGDDLLDLPAMAQVGFAASVADAHPSARSAAHFVASKKGGRGAVRQIADRILEARADTAAADRPEPRFGVVIPARFGSSRLPGKPLLDLAGKPMVLHVVENARRAGAEFVIVATDDERIRSAVAGAGQDVVMTKPDHASGTDRLAEVARILDMDHDAIVVNMQGDEPLLEGDLVRSVARALEACPSAGMATAASPIQDASMLLDPNVVKVTTDREGMALGFSRAPIPWVRDLFRPGEVSPTLPSDFVFLRHIGLYAYRVGALIRLAAQGPVALERAESLEQLRAQWLGIRIHVTVTDRAPARGVDTLADLDEVRAILERRQRGGDDG